jgi:hypothetical protein
LGLFGFLKDLVEFGFIKIEPAWIGRTIFILGFDVTGTVKGNTKVGNLSKLVVFDAWFFFDEPIREETNDLFFDNVGCEDIGEGLI